jgi:hypothetical protein
MYKDDPSRVETAASPLDIMLRMETRVRFKTPYETTKVVEEDNPFLTSRSTIVSTLETPVCKKAPSGRGASEVR